MQVTMEMSEYEEMLKLEKELRSKISELELEACNRETSHRNTIEELNNIIIKQVNTKHNLREEFRSFTRKGNYWANDKGEIFLGKEAAHVRAYNILDKLF